MLIIEETDFSVMQNLMEERNEMFKKSSCVKHDKIKSYFCIELCFLKTTTYEMPSLSSQFF